MKEVSPHEKSCHSLSSMCGSIAPEDVVALLEKLDVNLYKIVPGESTDLRGMHARVGPWRLNAYLWQNRAASSEHGEGVLRPASSATRESPRAPFRAGPTLRPDG